LVVFFGLTAAISPVPTPVVAHEFWLEPERFRVDADQHIRADIKVGQDFKGDVFPYIASRFLSFERHDSLGTSAVEGTAGDIPALRSAPRGEGLSIFTYVSSGQRLTFREWEKFTSYLTYEGLNGVAARHDARGLPRDEIKEIYTRHAKTLVNVGDGATGQDRATGMALELVAGDNPGNMAAGGTMRFQLLWQGKPLPDTQVALFHRPEDGETTRTLTRTDADGHASFALELLPDRWTVFGVN
jgi:uncharacterized GH25 family protein